ncbi:MULTISPECIES: hypothetical protein [Pseudonocardia]|uniref:Uncharacterized protein n=2 Tax=Pseudonocardia TaxID=1847 RepID=A0A1Y2N644_PSEAH|nr:MULTISPECIES: hypothetical protein [Pseudonocardia]OSY42926.1 hypothetical protein BG845_01168 [Pseudonocardia autotrophica]TDN77502.1 hypothetical protein C8E95_6750 [Pseudonocardia autotrophica]BBG01527.1 hypothetical protein Pdca_27360 [Pseudonocardia autotrophica]GEC25311.1 hypothetical protein PSA01_23400 [Pseudonocardia saturnea]
MPPRARTTGPEFMTSPTVAAYVAAALQESADKLGEHTEHGAPVLTPTERAHQSMLNRAARELDEFHNPVDDQ